MRKIVYFRLRQKKDDRKFDLNVYLAKKYLESIGFKCVEISKGIDIYSDIYSGHEEE